MCFLMQYHPLLNHDHERLLSLAVKNPKHSCHTVDIVAAAFLQNGNTSSFFVSSLLEFTLRAWRHLFVALSPSIPHRADLGNDKILFVWNIAWCQGKRLNICTKLWCSSDFRFQRADSAFPSVISSTQSVSFSVRLIHVGPHTLTLVQSSAQTAGCQKAVSILFFHLGEQLLFKVWDTFCQPVCLRINSFCCHMTTHTNTHARTQFMMFYWSC